MSDPALLFIDQSRRYLRDEYLPKIENCVRRLGEEDLWWRPNEAANSIGNLLLHLAGNVRQWIVSGVGGASDVRARQEEFDQRDPLPAEALLERLRAALDEVDAVLAGLTPADLVQRRHIQGHDVTVLAAIYHVVEHFGMHTGQILYITKLRTGQDLAFYAFSDGTPRRTWQQDQDAGA